MVPFGAAYWAMRRSRIGFQNMTLLGAVMLVEDLPFRAAADRSQLLVQQAGGLRNAVQKWYSISIGLLSGVLGAVIGSRGGIGAAESALVIMPIIAVCFMILMTVNGVVNSLMYLIARRASGESMQHILDDFEKSKQ